ncbi:MAG TPA: histidine phosphatase family protein [Thermomicrobiales bacterium]|nr:histidine phosphatase family protein [Thermomicrobiales bacterium]
MRLLLIRHGQTHANVSATIQGADDPLTDLGRQQARAAGRFVVEHFSVTHLYASPMSRARETAEIVGGYIDLSPAFEPGLAEIDAGTAIGMTWEAWSTANPDLALRMRSDIRTLEDGWIGGESGRQFSTRVLTAYNRLVTNHLGTDDIVAAVSHGGPLAWISARLHGDDMERWPFERSVFQNCSVTEIEIDADGIETVCALNSVEHLRAINEAAGLV